MSELWKKLKLSIQNFNLFPSIPPATDEQKVRIQRIATRLYVLLLIVSILILLLYTSLIDITYTVNVKTPTLTEYSQLHLKYSDTLTCPCQKLSINYKEFLHVHHTFHQVCKSDFVTPEWFLYLSNFKGYPDAGDFRITSAHAFQALGMFCELINRTMYDSIIRFYSTEYIRGSITPFKLFESQVQSFIDQFKSSTINQFLLSLAMNRQTTHNNALFSGRLTNYRLYQYQLNDSRIIVQRKGYRNCYCDYSSTCIYQCAIYDDDDGTFQFIIPGFYTGCYVIEALLRSNLECFYNQTCINRLDNYFALPNSSIDVTALNPSLPSQYLPNSTIQQLLDHLLIEEWNGTVMYNRYYDQCQPTQCTYTVKTKNSVIYITTTVISIIGGLATILELVVPWLVKVIIYIINKFKMRRMRRVMPISET